MKILITGGQGFIGGYTATTALNAGHKVTLLDHKVNTTISLGRSIGEDRPLNSPIKKAPPYEIYVGSVNDESLVDEMVARSDGVIHVAGVLGTSETIDFPNPAIQTNIMGSLNIFQACKRYDKKCVYITVGNYWMNNSYSITKTTAERFAWMFNKEHGTKIAVVRALNAYGPGQKEKPVRKIMPNFILPVLRGEPITIYGDGNQIMDMIFVQDVADILVRALTVNHNQYIFDPQQNEDNHVKFEAGSGVRTTVNDIADMVIKEIGYGEKQHVPMRGGEPEHSVVIGRPSTLAPLYGGQTPTLTSLADGIRLTVDWYKNHVSK